MRRCLRQQPSHDRHPAPSRLSCQLLRHRAILRTADVRSLNHACHERNALPALWRCHVSKLAFARSHRASLDARYTLQERHAKPAIRLCH